MTRHEAVRQEQSSRRGKSVTDNSVDENGRKPNPDKHYKVMRSQLSSTEHEGIKGHPGFGVSNSATLDGLRRIRTSESDWEYAN